MQPTAACLAILWLVRHAAAISRSSAVSAEIHSTFLARRDGHDNVSSGDVLVSSNEAAEASLSGGKGGKGGNGAKKDKESQKDEPDTDSLSHELVDQATTQPYKKRFDRVDRNGDGKIDEWEYFASTRANRRIATNRFNCTDENRDYSISPQEFTDAQAKPQELDRCVSMMLAFKLMDRDRDGGISQQELWNNLGGPSFDSRWAFTVACSDTNRDGRVSPMEFSKDVYGCVEEKQDAAMVRFSNFSKSDADSDGCANETEMAVSLSMLFGLNLLSNETAGPGLSTRKLARRWMSCTNFNSDQCLSEKEYNKLLSPSPAQSRCIGTSYEMYEADMDFELMDANHDDKVSRQEYYNWIAKLDIEIDQQDAEALFNSADVNGNDFVEEKEFHNAGEEHEGDGPGYLLFRAAKSHRAWLGSIQKMWAGDSTI
jgi:Ca2+-binding EF-hand superfamily protein